MSFALFGGVVVAAAGISLGIKYLLNRKKKTEVNLVTHTPTNRASAKRALLVGICKYRPDLNADLRGCVNDVENVREMLMKYYGFEADNVRVLIDDRATKAAILERLSWLIGEAVPGDVLVFHYSGHGSQVRDREGDELDDQLDEILCPYDLNWNDPLTDDVLANMFDKVPVGAHLIMISDSCHSGTITKELVPGNPHPTLAKFIMPPFDIRCRTLGRDLPKNSMNSVTRGSQRHVLISGCKDSQTSADAFIDGKYQGALTWALTSSVKVAPDVTWTDLHAKIMNRLSSGYTQTPQLSGDPGLLDDRAFKGQ